MSQRLLAASLQVFETIEWHTFSSLYLFYFSHRLTHTNTNTHVHLTRSFVFFLFTFSHVTREESGKSSDE